jgi:hypothetical protein
MEAAVLRKELKSYIDDLPDRKLQALQPLLFEYARSDYDLDADVTAEESAEIDERIADYHRDPSSFVALEDL